MKLIIQIPCYNEAETLPETISELPREMAGFDSVEYLVIDDGSIDGTSDVARRIGVHHIVRLKKNCGLATAFKTGLENALALGADVIVNTDADNQYHGEDIARLIKPILEGDAEITIGDRQIDTIKHFSPIKRLLQKIGSWVVRWASNTDIPDTTSGFRAFTRDAAMKMEIYTDYTYTLETIIQAGKKRIPITSVKITINEKLRESRLIKSIPTYIRKSTATILRIFLMYEALRVFLIIGSVMFGMGLALSIRFLIFFALGEGSGHLQSLILASILFIMGFQAFLIGLIADMISKNRHLNEDINYRLRKLEYDNKKVVLSDSSSKDEIKTML